MAAPQSPSRSEHSEGSPSSSNNSQHSHGLPSSSNAKRRDENFFAGSASSDSLSHPHSPVAEYASSFGPIDDDNGKESGVAAALNDLKNVLQDSPILLNREGRAITQAILRIAAAAESASFRYRFPPPSPPWAPVYVFSLSIFFQILCPIVSKQGPEDACQWI